MTTITINAETIAKLEAAGFNRWTKGNMDRLYVNAQTLGLEVERYKTGNVSNATWQGETISNADARRLMASKVWIDIATGELHVRTDYYNGIDESMTLESVASAYVESIVAEPEDEPETEEVTETETIQISSESTISGNYISAPKQSGKPIDVPTDERVTVELDGRTYERTIYHRLAYRNMGTCKVLASFVIIDGTNYLV